ncbi:RlpA-like double-psi beta-barrel-protein domain-containing protein-containing protein [Mycena sp. CBHHK59/15]|nr:RlpA-like double-psi beta-barrel-protein domain-containing protein-containing protein [Mycena sp. CBHHK59/15]
MLFFKSIAALLATATMASAAVISARDFTAIATYYDPNGGFGACGNPLGNGDLVVALSPSQYASGTRCGQRINVSYNGKGVSLVVADLCPGCQGANGIDLTEGVMALLEPNYIALGKITVDWAFA